MTYLCVEKLHAANRPEKPQDWDAIEETPCKDFSTGNQAGAAEGQGVQEQVLPAYYKVQGRRCKKLVEVGSCDRLVYHINWYAQL